MTRFAFCYSILISDFSGVKSLVMSCQFPFQSIRCLEVDGERSNRFLVAAAGPELHVYDVKTGGRRSVWTAAAAVNVNVSANANANADAAQAQKKKEEEHDGTGVSAPAIGEALENEHGHEHDGPPEKRRKLSVPAQEAEAGTTTTAATEVDDGKGAKTNNSGGGGVSAAAPSLSVSLLAVSRTKGLVVVVTGEDKCVRTLQINSDGGLSQMSERYHLHLLLPSKSSWRPLIFSFMFSFFQKHTDTCPNDLAQSF